MTQLTQVLVAMAIMIEGKQNEFQVVEEVSKDHTMVKLRGNCTTVWINHQTFTMLDDAIANEIAIANQQIPESESSIADAQDYTP
jgi:hypothetical protein